ncbi:MAG: tRNA (adenosine(37)-N6)-threonylcarbamoyltransferase complex dimerization subunit type 1 TsaB [Sphingobacteriaceae bacterium]
MALILQIETSTPSCSVALAENGQLLAKKERTEANIHAGSITLFIEELMQVSGKSYRDLNAVAVSMGPGSYTGLRIGVSTAKGLCYGLDIPLIAISTLQAMAAAKQPMANVQTLLCPMIDARRMEVYMALFDNELAIKQEVKAEILDGHTFDAYLQNYQILLFGDGAEKCKTLYSGPQFSFAEHENSAADLSTLAFQKYQQAAFEDLAYFEPFYLKEFMITKPKGTV